MRQTCEAKVCHLRCPVLVEKNVGTLDIAMKNLGCCMMQMREPTCSIQRYSNPLLPTKSDVLDTAPLETLVDIATSKVLIDQKSLSAMASEAHEDDKVWMPEFAEDLNFLFETGFFRKVQCFDSNLRPIL
jgi:hypothetical protein